MCLLLQLQGLSKSFGDRQVLHQLEWELPRGRGLHALLAGPGQGKSVLARILEGMLPAVGDVRVNGAPPGPGALGYVATEPDFGGARVETWLAAARRAGSWDEGIARVVLGDTPAGCAGGRLDRLERARLALALAVAPRPALVWLDDPGRTLGDAERATYVQLVQKALDRHDGGFVLATRDVRPWEALVEDITIMHGGRRLDTAPVSELLRDVKELHFTLKATARGWSALRRAGVLRAATDRLQKAVVVRRADAELKRQLEESMGEEVRMVDLELQQIFEAYVDVSSTGTGTRP
jgi:ABC-type multidrug transport system ATPase subunit